MISNDKLREVKKKLRDGEPEGEIREGLKKEGYSNEDIKRAFPAHHYDMRTWYLISAIILLLVGLWLFLRIKSFLFLILAALMFWQYFREIKRIRRPNKRNEKKRKFSANEPIIWTGDLDDDCTAHWAGLLLRAEWMDEDYWWWSVSEDGASPTDDNIDDSNNYNERFIGGETSRKRAERVAREYLEKIGIIPN